MTEMCLLASLDYCSYLVAIPVVGQKMGPQSQRTESIPVVSLSSLRGPLPLSEEKICGAGVCCLETVLPGQVLLFRSTHQTVLKLHEASQVLKKNKKDTAKVPSSSELNRAAVNFWLSV